MVRVKVDQKKDKFNHNMYTFIAFLAYISLIFYDIKQAWQQLFGVGFNIQTQRLQAKYWYTNINIQ